MTKTPNLTKPLANYAHGRWAGDLFYIAGQGARDPETNIEAGITPQSGSSSHDKTKLTYDIKIQTRAVFANIERALTGQGLGRQHLVDISVFLINMKDFSEMNDIWNEFFAGTSPPTRTTVAVVDLPGRNFVEMKAIATKSLFMG